MLSLQFTTMYMLLQCMQQTMSIACIADIHTSCNLQWKHSNTFPAPQCESLCTHTHTPCAHTHTPCACTLVVKTFKNSTAQRVPSEYSQLRYTSDILEYLFKSTAERVPSECSWVRYTCDIFLWLHKAFCPHASRVEVDCGMIAGYYIEVWHE